jgi:hypothetical protein
MNRRFATRVALPLALPLALALVTLVAACGGGDDGDGRPEPAALAAVDTAARAPEGVRIRVQVLNGTSQGGLARRATLYLRDLGYDVVDFANREPPVTATEITVRPDRGAWGARLQRALGTGTVTQSASLSPYIDGLVVLGPDWTPPAEPFRP